MRLQRGDELTFMPDAEPGQRVLGFGLLAFGLFLLYKGLTVDFLHTPRVTGPLNALFVKGGTLFAGALLSLGGYFNAFMRTGLTLNRAKRTVFAWDSYGFYRSKRARPLTDFNRVLIGRETLKGETIYPVSLGGTDQKEFPIQKGLYAHDRARVVAEDVAGFLNFPVDDQSGVVPKQTKGPESPG